MAASFKTSASKLVFERSSFLHKNSRHSNIVDHHYFNHAIDIMLPGVTSVPQQVNQCLKAEPYFMATNVLVSELISPNFIQAFVKKGHLHMLSHDTRIDETDCLAVLPTGHLILHLTKDTYETLGLEGKKSDYTDKKHPTKFVVTIDMTASYFIPGKNNYKRVQACLTKCDLRFNIIYNWSPPEAGICPSSVTAYFASRGYESVRKSNRTKFTQHNLRIPHISSDNFDSQSSCSYSDFYEWLGGTACQIKWSESVDNFINTLTIPEPSTEKSCCLSYQTRGFVSPHHISQTITALRSYMKTSNCPWASITVHGFQDSPVSLGTREHGFKHIGDNTYTYVVLPNEDYWLYMAIGDEDVCP